MTLREQDVFNYYINKLHWFTPYEKEADFLKEAITLCEMLESCVVRQAFATKRGVADLILCYHGLFVAAELKDSTGTPSRQQLNFIKKVEAAGGRAKVVDNLHDLFWLLAKK